MGSSPVRFAKGGVMAFGTSNFRTSDGRTGTFGEAGPEVGFFPLDRGPDGRLGIRSRGGGGSNVSRTTIVQMTVRAEDPNAFRASAPQLIADATRAARLRR